MKKIKSLLSFALTMSFLVSFSSAVYADENLENISSRKEISTSLENQNLSPSSTLPTLNEVANFKKHISGFNAKSVFNNLISSKDKIKSLNKKIKSIDTLSTSLDSEIETYSEETLTYASNSETDSSPKSMSIEKNTDYSDSMSSNKESHVYFINADGMDKMTVLVNFSSANAFATSIYKATENGYELVATSPYNGLHDYADQLSYIPEGGEYAIVVYSMNPGDFTLRVQESDYHSDAEPNDNMFYANENFRSLSIEDSFDNDYDTDWNMLTVTEDNEYSVDITTNNADISSLYLVNFDSHYVEPVKDTVSLPRGKYYLIATGTGSSPDNSYSITMTPKYSPVSKVDVTSIKSPSFTSKTTYGEGSKYVVKDSMTISGTAYNTDGLISKNADIKISFKTASGNIVDTTATTDADGKFTASLTLPNSKGEKSYTNNSTTYYYDLADLEFTNCIDETITSNENSLYHFSSSKVVAATAGKVVVSKITSPSNGSNSKINYGEGYKWRVYKSMTITGTAYTTSGSVLQNGSFTVSTISSLNKKCSATATTDANGKFTVTVQIGSGAGYSSYYAYASTHYYDVIPLTFTNTDGTKISCSDNSLYQFAYSIYHRF